MSYPNQYNIYDEAGILDIGIETEGISGPLGLLLTSQDMQLFTEVVSQLSFDVTTLIRYGTEPIWLDYKMNMNYATCPALCHIESTCIYNQFYETAGNGVKAFFARIKKGVQKVLAFIKEKVKPAMKIIAPAVGSAFPAAAPYVAGATTLINLIPNLNEGDDPSITSTANFSIVGTAGTPEQFTDEDVVIL